MSTLVHVNIPKGFYLGQIRLRGHRLWETVTNPHDKPEPAMAGAVLKMTPEHKRARVIFVDDSGWYEPNQVMECTR